MIDSSTLGTLFSGDYPGIETLQECLLEPVFGEKFHPVDKLLLQESSDDLDQADKKRRIKSIRRIGYVDRDVMGDPVNIFDVTLTDEVRIARCRVEIQRLIRSKILTYSHALMIFHHEDPADREWRFSYAYKGGGDSTTTTDPKRYTFLFGSAHHCRTAVERFERLSESDQTDEDFERAFSVSALTQEFYVELFRWYELALKPETGITFPNDVSVSEDDRDELDVKIIRLITRLLFVWFIREKGLIPDALFDIPRLKEILRDFDENATDSSAYYNAILQNLFFATLNRPNDGETKRAFATGKGRDDKTLYRYEEFFSISPEEVIRLFSPVPFLNGGLFECLDKEMGLHGVQVPYHFDGFSRNGECHKNGVPKHRAFIPNWLFFDKDRGLISILSKYNFTVEESTPLDQQVALDPELLGKVFENLLGAYNPETKETARNQSGSFYTPREIVHYMVDQSLLAYLGDGEEVRALMSDDYQSMGKFSLSLERIADQLNKLRILDPACGSGAFPMGLLDRMVDLYLKINPDQDHYQLKLRVIEHSIYGADIQPIAVQITKLRFFIALICDAEVDDTKPNRGIQALPNLETKFIAADTLKRVEWKREQGKQVGLFESHLDSLKDQLLEIRHKHFLPGKRGKKALREEDRQLRIQIRKEMEENGVGVINSDFDTLVEWDPYDQNGHASFFDPDWMFGVKEGFHIVIGNPPYVQLQNDGGKLADQYMSQGYQSFARTGDIYCLFYERGIQLLAPDGILCYITSNKWMRAGYGERLRTFLATETTPLQLIDFGGIQIFESATVDTNILLLANRKNDNKTKTTAVTIKGGDKGVINSTDQLSDYIEQNASQIHFPTSDSWVILSPIEQRIKEKIEKVGVPLKDWDIQIYRGILTGCNEAFIISTEKRNEILANCQTEEERKRTADLIRPILRGRDIKRYGYDWADLWVLFIPWHFPLHLDSTIKGASKEAEKAFQDKYPAVYSHLLGYKDKLSKRNKSETGIRYEWYALQRWGANYVEEFERPKIMYPNMTKFLPFYYDKKGFYQNDKSFMITGSQLAFLTAFLNSSLFKYCFQDNFPYLQGGTRELRKIFFEQIPVVIVSESINEEFAQLIEILQKDYNQEVADKVDKMIFDLYHLTKQERLSIRSITK